MDSSEIDIDSDKCVFCHQLLSDNKDDIVVLREKGSSSINTASEKRHDAVVVKPGQKVHISCRKKYVNEKYINIDSKRKSLEDDSIEQNYRNLRSSEPNIFIMKEHCLFCGNGDKFQGKKTSFELVPVRTEKSFYKSIVETA